MMKINRIGIASVLGSALLFSTAQADPPSDRGDGDRPDRVRPEGRRPGGDRGRGDRERGPGGRGPGGGPPPFERMMRALPLVSAIDADGDGTISAKEMENASVALKSLDQDGDGQLSNRELMPDLAAMGPPQDDDRRGRRGPGYRGPGEFMERMFDGRDKDGDGKLSGDEIPERLSERLDKVDTDKDGAITKDELKAGMRKMGGRRGEKEARGRRKPGGDKPRRPESEE